MERRYEVDVSHEGRRDVRLSVSGDVDLSTAPELLDAILSAAFTFDRGQVIVDMAAVSFMDVTGASALREAHRHLVADGTRLSVRNVSPTLQELLHATGLDTYLNIEVDGGPGAAPGAPYLRRVV